MSDTINDMPTVIAQQQLAQELVVAARADGEARWLGRLLTGSTKTVLETALEAEMSAHLRYGQARASRAQQGHLLQRNADQDGLSKPGPESPPPVPGSSRPGPDRRPLR